MMERYKLILDPPNLFFRYCGIVITCERQRGTESHYILSELSVKFYTFSLKKNYILFSSSPLIYLIQHIITVIVM